MAEDDDAVKCRAELAAVGLMNEAERDTEAGLADDTGEVTLSLSGLVSARLPMLR